jgi:hypothetical protein
MKNLEFKWARFFRSLKIPPQDNPWEVRRLPAQDLETLKVLIDGTKNLQEKHHALRTTLEGIVKQYKPSEKNGLIGFLGGDKPLELGGVKIWYDKEDRGRVVQISAPTILSNTDIYFVFGGNRALVGASAYLFNREEGENTFIWEWPGTIGPAPAPERKLLTLETIRCGEEVLNFFEERINESLQQGQ